MYKVLKTVFEALESQEKGLPEASVDTPEETYTHTTCDSCEGAGGYSLGSCEEGVWETCALCEGFGYIEEEA